MNIDKLPVVDSMMDMFRSHVPSWDFGPNLTRRVAGQMSSRDLGEAPELGPQGTA
jgi:hypothetical protein